MCVCVGGAVPTPHAASSLWVALLDCSPFWAEPVAVNYYPAPTASFIRDELDMRRLQLTVVTDRAHGIGCLGQGQLEVPLWPSHLARQVVALTVVWGAAARRGVGGNNR